MEYRHVRCPGCSVKLRIRISEKNYGKMIEITCPECKTKCRVKIPLKTSNGRRNYADDFFDDLFKGNLFK